MAHSVRVSILSFLLRMAHAEVVSWLNAKQFAFSADCQLLVSQLYLLYLGVRKLLEKEQTMTSSVGYWILFVIRSASGDGPDSQIVASPARKYTGLAW
jgi:hypothetical protein